MPTKLIELSDAILVEVEVEPNEARPISGGFAERVGAGLDTLRPVLTRVCAPVVESWKDLSETFTIDQAEIEVALSFEAEGSIYIAKGKAGANLTVKFVLKAKKPAVCPPETPSS